MGCSVATRLVDDEILHVLDEFEAASNYWRSKKNL
jgi:hypothetical protein